MPRQYRPWEVIRVLERLGWVRLNQESSHIRLALPDGSHPLTVSTSHREVPRGTLGSIVRQAGMTRREFNAAAEEIL